MESGMYEMGENHQQQQQKFSNGEDSSNPVFTLNPSHQYDQQPQPYMFQDVPSFFHYQHHFQALLQQQRRLQDQQQCVLVQESVPTSTTIAAAGISITPSVPCFALNFKPDLNENIRNNGRLCEGEDALLRGSKQYVPETRRSAAALATSHYCWQNQEDSAVRQPSWAAFNKCCRKPQCTDLSDKRSSGTMDKEEVQPEMNHRCCKETEQINTLESSKTRLFGELEAICRNASITNANRTGSTEHLATTTTSTAGLESDFNQFNANAVAVPPVGFGHDHDGSETFTGDDEAPLRTVQKIKERKKLKDELGSLALFFEGLVHQLMEQQEILYGKFMEAIERLDKERKEREEAWRQQELEKLEQDAAAKARERALASSREASIISYLEKITGQSIKLPPRNRIQVQPISSSEPTSLELSSSDKGRDDFVINMTSKGWPKAEVEALIQIRGSLESKFQEPGFKGPLWEEISNSMCSMGFQRSAKRCKEKWENINKYFKKSRENSGQCRKKLKTCQYFDQLDQLYSSKSIANGSYSCSSSSEHQAKPTNEIEGLVPAGNFIKYRTASIDFNGSSNENLEELQQGSYRKRNEEHQLKEDGEEHV